MAKTEQIVYFEDTSKWQANTKRVVEVVGEALTTRRIKHVVFATCTGYTGAQFAALAKAHPKVSFLGVGMSPAIDRMYDVKWNAAHGKAMERAGIRFMRGTHVLTGGADRALRAKFDGGFPPTAIVAETLYMFSQGMKVCVEIVGMACDAGALPDGVEVISCAGTGNGADTAVVVKSAASANLFDIDVHRILTMPLKK
jgi:hypothetical protein